MDSMEISLHVQESQKEKIKSVRISLRYELDRSFRPQGRIFRPTPEIPVHEGPEFPPCGRKTAI